MKKISKIAGVFLMLAAFSFGGCVSGGQGNVLYSDTNGSQQSQQIAWVNVQQGLDYADTLVTLDDGEQKEFFIVKVDPHLFEFKIYNNADKSKAKSLDVIQREQGSVLAFNGAFFDKNFQPLGLLQDGDTLLHNKGPSSLMNGIFAVANVPMQPMAIVAPVEGLKKDHINFMIQNGPVLLDNDGNILLTTDTGKKAARTALAVDNQGNVILIILHQTLLDTENSLSLYQFAHLLRENALFAPLGLHSVLNLDGGPSTGVVINGEYLPEMNSVENVVIVVPRKTRI